MVDTLATLAINSSDLGDVLPVGALIGLISLLVGVLAIAAQSLRTTSGAIQDLAETNIALNKELGDAIKERRDSETARHAMLTQMDTLSEKNRRLTALVASLEDDLSQLRRDSEKATLDLTKEIAEVRAHLADARQQLVDLRAEAKGMKKTIAELTSALKSAQDRVRELELKERELDVDLREARSRIALLEKDNREKDAEITALSARVNELEAELARMRRERERLEQEKAELQARLRLLENAEAGTEPTDDTGADVAQSEEKHHE